MYNVNDVALKDGKEVKVIAVTSDGSLVCRYLEDIEGKHVNRCYLYRPDQLTSPKKNIISIYDLCITRSMDSVVATVPYTKYPNNEEIIRQIVNYNGTGASVKRRYKLT